MPNLWDKKIVCSLQIMKGYIESDPWLSIRFDAGAMGDFDEAACMPMLRPQLKSISLQLTEEHTPLAE